MVAAAGNKGDATLQYPAAYPSVISVAASSEHDPRERASWSNHGPGLDLIAPGENLISACYGGIPGVNERQICFAEGTSYATPIVAGAAALLLAENPTWTPQQVRAHLRANAYRDAGMSEHETGAGLLRIDRAFGFPAPTGAHDRYLDLELSDGEHSVSITTDLLTGIGSDHDASALLSSGDVTLSLVWEGRTFSTTFPLPLARVRQPPERAPQPAFEPPEHP